MTVYLDSHVPQQPCALACRVLLTAVYIDSLVILPAMCLGSLCSPDYHIRPR